MRNPQVDLDNGTTNEPPMNISTVKKASANYSSWDKKEQHSHPKPYLYLIAASKSQDPSSFGLSLSVGIIVTKNMKGSYTCNILC